MSSTIDEGSSLLRIVLDTNVLVDSTQDPFNAPAQLIDAIKDQHVIGLATPATAREYRKIIKRLVVSEEERDDLLAFAEGLTIVVPARVDVDIDDPEDFKFLQAAAGGEADLLVTNDRHLLDVGEIGNVRIVRPTEALAALKEKGDGEWASWVRGLGIN